MTPERKQFVAKLEGHIGIWGNVVLFVFKAWVGITTGSVAIMADAWHSLSDSISSILVLVGLRISARPADDRHPFGYGRAEVLTSLVIAVLLWVIGFEFIRQGIGQLVNHEAAHYGTFAIVATLVSIAIKEGMAQYAFWAARKTDYTSLKADGHHHRSDAISSIVVLAGILVGGSYWWMDGVLSIVVALIILYAGWSVFMEAGRKLLGEAPGEQLEEDLRRICLETHGHDIACHHIHLHRYGEHCELTFHIRFSGDASLRDAHHYAHAIETAVERELKMRATIHIEPIKSGEK